jgi:acyl-CoA-binding protein
MTTLAQAQQDVNKLSKKPNNDNLLFLYAHYKQATAGDVSGKRPGMLEVIDRMKFDAWTKIKGMSKADAEAKYIARVEALLKADGK